MLQTCRSKCENVSAKIVPNGEGGQGVGQEGSQWRRIAGYWVLRTSPSHLPRAALESTTRKVCFDASTLRLTNIRSLDSLHVRNAEEITV